jgi:hypothetical protein
VTTLGATIGFMIGGKVLSPQFMLWIAPLLALAPRGVVDTLMALATAGLTTAVYPYLSPALEQRAEGHAWALAALSGRNLLLLGWYAFAVVTLARRRATSPARRAFDQQPAGATQ